MSYTIKNLREIDDVAPRFGFDSIQEARFATSMRMTPVLPIT